MDVEEDSDESDRRQIFDMAVHDEYPDHRGLLRIILIIVPENHCCAMICPFLSFVS